MSFVKEVKENYTILKIDGAMSIYEAVSLHQACIDSLETGEKLIIDLKGVTDCDITGLQLLHATRITAESAGKVFEIATMSPTLIDAFNNTGLNSKFKNLKSKVVSGGK